MEEGALEISQSALQYLFESVTKRKGEGRCLSSICASCASRAVSLPSQGQLGVEPSSSELNPEARERLQENRVDNWPPSANEAPAGRKQNLAEPF